MVLAFPADARRHALLVGNNFGGAGLDTLHYAESDAKRFSGVLQEISGFENGDVQLITPCDSLGLETALEEMRKTLAKPGAIDDLFLFYYSGHSDRGGLNLGDKRFPLERLKQAFQAMPGRVKIGIFDACQSGLLTRGKGARMSSPITLGELNKISGQVIIASSASDERSLESDELRSGVFTHHWLNGLRGSADLSGDRKVTLGEAYQYAYQMTIQTSTRSQAGMQHPAYQFQIHGEGDIVLADLSQGGAGVSFDPGQDGKFLVLDRDKNQVLADFYKNPGREIRIALPMGAYRILKVERGEWLVSDIQVRNTVLRFDPASLRPQPQVVSMIKGSLKDDYVIMEGPLRVIRTGATRRFGVSLKVGEASGNLGIALLYNLRPELQIQAGLGAGFPLNQDLGGSQSNKKYFLLARQYEGPYFLQSGLGYVSTKVVAKNLPGEAKSEANRGEFLMPLHVGFEVGPRRTLFASFSMGFNWVFTGGGEVFSYRTSAGRLIQARSEDSDFSLGISVGTYAF